MITAKEILMGRDVIEPLTVERTDNLLDLLPRVNLVRFHWGKPLIVSSGYRPPAINAKVGGAKNSAHMACMAVDFADPDGSFGAWCLANIHIIAKAGLYLEDPNATPGWVHLQSRPTVNRVFAP